MHRSTKIFAIGVAIVLPVILLAQIDSTVPSVNTTSAPSTTTTSTDTASAAQNTATQTTTTSTGQAVPATTTTAATTNGRAQTCTALAQRVVMSQATEETTFTQCSLALSSLGQGLVAEEAAETLAIAQSRAAWDKTRTDQFAQLRARATTDREKAAVEQFVAVMNSAVRTRKEGVSGAVATFHGRRKSAIGERSTIVSNVSGRHRAWLEEMSVRARTACLNGGSEAEIVRAVTASRESIRPQIESASVACQNPQAALNERSAAIAAERAAAIERSLAEFRTRAAAARAELRAAFGLPAEG